MSEIYKSPESGFYEVRAKLFKIVCTGNKVSKRNPFWRWYTPWKPKFVLVDEYIQEESMEGREIRFYNEGDKITPEDIIRRL